MRVLVTGCAGFIGYNLCDRLLEDGHEVVGVDNFCTGQKQNADDLATRAGFEFVEHNIIQPLSISGDFEIVYNLACPASPVDFGPKRLDILEVCSRGVWNLLDFCREKGARLLHTSTSEVYGDPKEHPQKETYWGHVNPIGARCCYDEGKRCAETLFFDYRRQHNTKIKVARIFNTYGPRMLPDDGRVVSNFIMQALQGRDITIYGDGGQSRSFCFVDDLVDGLVRLMNSKPELTGPVNLGNPGEFTIGELAEKVISMTGSSSGLVYRPLPQDDPTQRQPDITLARTELGWQPGVTLEEGLRATIDYFRTLLPSSGG